MLTLDSQHSPLGCRFVLPTWVGGGDGPAPPEPPAEAAHPQWRTQIALPLKRSVQPGAVGSMLDDLHPSLLLFLRSLRCIAVRGPPPALPRILRRRDCGNGCVEVTSSDGASCTYLLVSRELAFRPPVKRLEVAVDCTTVAAAFVLGGGPLPGGRPAQQSVFAFLPLRSYGLRFVLQADWVVPSNREAVDCDSGWNQRLRDEARRPPSAAGQSAARSRRVRQT